MEPALDVMSRALQGDPGARSFLERTTSIYVLDVTDTANPKTYGCWNFIHQAMNEIERFESSHFSNGIVSSLVSQARLLATMALRVARRSPAKDKALVATCILNAAHVFASPAQSQWLIDLNLELREIVMGRIAAMAFDFSFHRMVGLNGMSAFADRVVMDTFCAILSANAISSGPPAIQHFATEWVIPSSRNLPTFAVASVVHHLALEGMRKSSPAGTKDTLQRLSNSVVVVVLVPTLLDAITDSDEDGDLVTNISHQDCARIATICLRALKVWCNATDLSLPQINHICSKANLNIVEILSDSMYSDSDLVVDALAELVEFCLPLSDEKVMSEGRMNQVRHILQVDEATFKERFSPVQLKTIEFRETGVIVEELVSAIGLQRFRFAERQNKGEHGLCRNLARICVSISNTFLEVPFETRPRPLETGALTLLMKAAAYPVVNVCALSIPVLTNCLAAMPSLAIELLPLLQRRAIIPHRFRDGTLFFSVPDQCEVNLAEFQSFRDTILRDAMLACWNANPPYYIQSCASAVEEFCCDHCSVEVSLQLEAALFCIEIICPDPDDINDSFEGSEQMINVIAALALKPASLMLNPLTSARACKMLRTYAPWCIAAGKDLQASEICVSSFITFQSNANHIRLCDDFADSSLSPVLEAALTLKEFLSRCPLHFASETSAAALRATWDASHVDTESPAKTLSEARLALGTGLVYVFQVMAEEHRPQLFEELLSRCLKRLEDGTKIVTNGRFDDVLTRALAQFSEEIRLFAGLTLAFSSVSWQQNHSATGNHVGSNTPEQQQEMTKPYVVATIRKGLSAVYHAVAQLADNENIASALKSFFSDMLPLSAKCMDLTLLQDLCSLTAALLAQGRRSASRFDIMFHFLGAFAESYGGEIEKAAYATLEGSSTNGRGQELGRLLEAKILDTFTTGRQLLGAVWIRPREQGQGQPPFETKTPTVQTIENCTNDALEYALDTLAVGMQRCPVFMLHLPAEFGIDRDDDTLLRRAVDSAAAALNGDALDIIKSALNFLQSLTRLVPSPNAVVHSSIVHLICRVRGSVIGYLLAGACGRFPASVLPETAELLLYLLNHAPRDELEDHLITALRHQDSFLLGDPAKNVTLSFLQRCVLGNRPVSEVERFLNKLWEMHQEEDTESLPTSDIVAKFVAKYSA